MIADFTAVILGGVCNFLKNYNFLREIVEITTSKAKVTLSVQPIS